MSLDLEVFQQLLLLQIEQFRQQLNKSFLAICCAPHKGADYELKMAFNDLKPCRGTESLTKGPTLN